MKNFYIVVREHTEEESAEIREKGRRYWGINRVIGRLEGLGKFVEAVPFYALRTRVLNGTATDDELTRLDALLVRV